MGKHYKYEFKLKVVQEYLNSSLGYRALTKKYEIIYSVIIVIFIFIATYEAVFRILKNSLYIFNFT